MKTISQAELKAVLKYDPGTGVFSRVKRASGRPAPAGGVPNCNGYLLIMISRQRYYAHRLAWLYMTGEWPELIDHIDRNRANNAWHNLRQTTRQANYLNSDIADKRASVAI